MLYVEVVALSYLDVYSSLQLSIAIVIIAYLTDLTVDTDYFPSCERVIYLYLASYVAMYVLNSHSMYALK